jgi:transaldolase
MAICIDSAIIEEVKSARSLGWVRGVTTNPVLLAKAGSEAREILSALALLNMGWLFYQLVSLTVDEMFEEMQLAAEVVGPSLILKVPPTENGFRFVAQCREVPCCVTAIFSPAQALIAAEVKARYVAVYVNRATRLMGDGLKLVKDVAEILNHSQTEIVAASLKSSEEACASLSAGAHHLTLPYEVLMSFTNHPLTEQTLAEFQAKGIGIPSLNEKELCSV